MENVLIIESLPRKAPSCPVAGLSRGDQATDCRSECGVGAYVPGRADPLPDRCADRCARRDRGYHLAVARAADPGLQAAHELAAAGGKKTQVTAEGLDRMRELVAVVQDTGRYPSRTTGTAEAGVLVGAAPPRRLGRYVGTGVP